jgi:predicted nuclease of predicted toxin-antitoxin system
MRLLSNENIPNPSIHYLLSKGIDIISIGMEFPTIRDSEVMDIAIRENRIIITFDRDYGELIFRHNYKPDSGVVYLRLDDYSQEEPGLIVEKLMNSGLELARTLTVIDRHVIRQRKF